MQRIYIHFKMQNILITVAKTCEKVLWLNISESRKLSLIVEKSYYKTVIDSLAASVNITFSGR